MPSLRRGQSSFSFLRLARDFGSVLRYGTRMTKSHTEAYVEHTFRERLSNTFETEPLLAAFSSRELANVAKLLAEASNTLPLLRYGSQFLEVALDEARSDFTFISAAGRRLLLTLATRVAEDLDRERAAAEEKGRRYADGPLQDWELELLTGESMAQTTARISRHSTFGHELRDAGLI